MEKTADDNQDAIPTPIPHFTSKFNEEWDSVQRGSSILDEPILNSSPILPVVNNLPSLRGTTKRNSLRRGGGSLKKPHRHRSLKGRSIRNPVIHSIVGGLGEKDSIFYSPISTNGNPTEILATRFQAWRIILKDIIAHFRDIQASYDHRAKSLLRISNLMNSTVAPLDFLGTGGIYDATLILREYYKIAATEANKSKDIENDVILTLVGLRNDLRQKIKEIKGLSGDFKSSLAKEMENTRKAVNELQECLETSNLDSVLSSGRKDPYLLKLAADYQIERQIAEENYLHQAYLNLESSGRELEAIVVGEIQKSYSAYANILKREADEANSTFEQLNSGPVSMPKDHEWNNFTKNTENFVDPSFPLRKVQNIQYPGKDNELVVEVRVGLLERKSKYLKSYTPGWYVLTPTHLHEFKSTDKSQAPVMSLNLSEQKLKSLSIADSGSNKFMLKGRQTGVMHRGHAWIFRCESHETMISWYEALENLIEKSPQDRNEFVRRHNRAPSTVSHVAGSIGSSDGAVDDDDEPFSVSISNLAAKSHNLETSKLRPQPGGRFPSSDLLLDTSWLRSLRITHSPSSGSSGFADVQDLKLNYPMENSPNNFSITSGNIERNSDELMSGKNVKQGVEGPNDLLELKNHDQILSAGSKKIDKATESGLTNGEADKVSSPSKLESPNKESGDWVAEKNAETAHVSEMCGKSHDRSKVNTVYMGFDNTHSSSSPQKVSIDKKISRKLTD